MTLKRHVAANYAMLEIEIRKRFECKRSVNRIFPGS